jgi:hypothetical protein
MTAVERTTGLERGNFPDAAGVNSRASEFPQIGKLVRDRYHRLLERVNCRLEQIFSVSEENQDQAAAALTVWFTSLRSEDYDPAVQNPYWRHPKTGLGTPQLRTGSIGLTIIGEETVSPIPSRTLFNKVADVATFVGALAFGARLAPGLTHSQGKQLSAEHSAHKALHPDLKPQHVAEAAGPSQDDVPVVMSGHPDLSYHFYLQLIAKDYPGQSEQGAGWFGAGHEFRVSTDEAKDNILPAVAFDSRGGALVGWDKKVVIRYPDSNFGYARNRIGFQLISPNGKLVRSFDLTDQLADGGTRLEMGSPVVAYNPQSNAYAAAFWSTHEGGPSVYLQMISIEGVVKTKPVRVCDIGGQSWYPDLAIGNHGDSLVVWTQRVDVGGGRDQLQTWGNFFDRGGNAVGECFPISRGEGQDAAVIYNPAKDAYLATYGHYYIDGDGPHTLVLGREIKADGSVSEAFRVIQSDSDKGDVAVEVNSDGSYTAVWSDYGNNAIVKVQQFTPLGPSGPVLRLDSDAHRLSLAPIDESEFVIIYEQFPPFGDASDSRLWAVRLERGPGGAFVPSAPVRVSAGETNQRYPAVATRQEEGLKRGLVVWSDQRPGDAEEEILAVEATFDGD